MMLYYTYETTRTMGWIGFGLIWIGLDWIYDTPLFLFSFGFLLDGAE